MVDIASAFAFSIATFSTTVDEKKEIKKFCGNFSTNMRLLTHKDQDVLPHFDEIDESQIRLKGSSLNQVLIDNHDQVGDRGKTKGQLLLERLFGFCKTFKIVTRIFHFHLNLKTADLQDLFIQL